MGFTHRNVIIFGYELDTNIYQENKNDEDFEELLHDVKKDELAIFYDSVNQDYFYVGYLVGRSNSSRKGSYFENSIEFNSEDYNNRSELDNFLTSKNIIVEEEPCFNAFTHVV